MNEEIHLVSLVYEAQNGSKKAREELLEKYSPFIIKTVSKYCSRYVNVGRDEEISIGLMAFDEAVLTYKGKDNSNFLSFAELVIKHRLIDYFRRNKKNRTIPIDNISEVNVAINDEISDIIDGESLRSEILSLSKELKEFGITFNELVKNSPKHDDTRKKLMILAMNIAANNDVIKVIYNRKQLPQKELITNFNVSEKMLERFRKYIIAITLIFSGNYESLQYFILGGAKNGLSTEK